MALDLITVSEYKAYAGITSTNQDVAITVLIKKVSELVKNLCRRTFLDYVDEFKVDISKGPHNRQILLQETPLIRISTVEYSADYGSTYTELVEFTDYVRDEQTGAVELIAYPYTDAMKTNAFRITYNAGYETLPEDLKLAVFDLIGYYIRNDSAIHSHKAIGSNTVQIEYITNTSLPAHIKRVLDLHTAYYS